MKNDKKINLETTAHDSPTRGFFQFTYLIYHEDVHIYFIL